MESMADAAGQPKSKTILETFFNSNLHGVKWPKDTYCVVEFVTSKEVRVYQNISGGDHAEICMLKSNEFIRKIKEEINVYINYSCCGGCATAIIKRIDEENEKSENAEGELKINIIAAGPYNVERITCKDHTHSDPDSSESDENTAGLREIFQHPQISLRAFERGDWEDLMGLLKTSNDCKGEATFDDEEYRKDQPSKYKRSREKEDECAAIDFKYIAEDDGLSGAFGKLSTKDKF